MIKTNVRFALNQQIKSPSRNFIYNTKDVHFYIKLCKN